MAGKILIMLTGGVFANNFLFQMDMHELIDEQMRLKLNDSRKRVVTLPQTVPKKTNRLFSIFSTFQR